MDQAEEIRRLIENASNGYWYPIGIVTAVFSIVIVLLLHIWNQMLKANEKRHSTTEHILGELSKNQTDLTLLTQKIELRLEIHDEKISELRA